jgi:CheY-like chemotaxis protein
MDMVI